MRLSIVHGAVLAGLLAVAIGLGRLPGSTGAPPPRPFATLPPDVHLAVALDLVRLRQLPALAPPIDGERDCAVTLLPEVSGLAVALTIAPRRPRLMVVAVGRFDAAKWRHCIPALAARSSLSLAGTDGDTFHFRRDGEGAADTSVVITNRVVAMVDTDQVARLRERLAGARPSLAQSAEAQALRDAIDGPGVVDVLYRTPPAWPPGPLPRLPGVHLAGLTVRAGPPTQGHAAAGCPDGGACKLLAATLRELLADGVPRLALAPTDVRIWEEPRVVHLEANLGTQQLERLASELTEQAKALFSPSRDRRPRSRPSEAASGASSGRTASPPAGSAPAEGTPRPRE